MYLIVIAWLYVTVMMALAEAFSPGGSVLGAAITLVFYGLLPMGLLVYILGTPARKRQLHARRAAEHAAWLAQQPTHSDAPSATHGQQPQQATPTSEQKV